MADVSGVDNLTSSSNGSTSLAGIKSAVGNLNSAKAEVSGQVFTGNISAPNLSGTNTGDQTLPTDATLSTSDVTTNNASTSKHGFLKKLSNLATDFMNGQGAWASVKDSDLATTDITTNDVSTSKHGFVPKAPNDTTKFLRGDGTWAVPVGSTIKNGISSRSSSGSQVIAHGAGAAPRKVKLFASAFSSSPSTSLGFYNGSTTATAWIGGGTVSAGTDNTYAIYVQCSNSNILQATVTVDATNITLTWTLTGTLTCNFAWEVET